MVLLQRNGSNSDETDQGVEKKESLLLLNWSQEADIQNEKGERDHSYAVIGQGLIDMSVSCTIRENQNHLENLFYLQFYFLKLSNKFGDQDVIYQTSRFRIIFYYL